MAIYKTFERVCFDLVFANLSHFCNSDYCALFRESKNLFGPLENLIWMAAFFLSKAHISNHHLITIGREYELDGNDGKVSNDSRIFRLNSCLCMENTSKYEI